MHSVFVAFAGMTMPEGESSLVVIGAGLGRTGTNSLKLALEILYKKPCYHLKEIYLKRQKDVEKWVKLGNELNASPDGKLDGTIVSSIFEGYVAAVDHPACVYYKELSELYPDAKVILTTRNPEIWLTGVRRTILPRKVLAPRPWSFYFIRNIIGLKPLQDMYLNTWRRALGQDVDFTDDTAMLNGFIAWTERVKKTISPKRLLVYDISEGWEPLCQFLQKPVPTEPFPHLNEYKEMRRLFRLERRAGALLQWGLPTLIIFLLAYILYILLR